MPGEDGFDRTHVAHDVQLPHGGPVLVRQLLEARLVGDSDVVHEAVHPPEGLLGCVHELARGRRHGEVERDVQRLTHTGPGLAPAGGHDARALLGKHARARLADPFGRAGYDADALFEAELHGRLR